MKSASYYRKEALKTLDGKWNNAMHYSLLMLISWIVMMSSMVIIVLPIVLKANTAIIIICTVLACLLLVASSFVTFILQYILKAKFLGMSRGLDPKNVKVSVKRAFLGVLLMSILPSIVSQVISALAKSADEVFVQIVFMAMLFMVVILNVIYAVVMIVYPFVSEDNQQDSVDKIWVNCFRLTDGYKWRLFCLDISFIGWGLLCILSLGIGLLWVVPYQLVAEAKFYDDMIAEQNSNKPNQSINKEPITIGNKIIYQ